MHPNLICLFAALWTSTPGTSQAFDFRSLLTRVRIIYCKWNSLAQEIGGQGANGVGLQDALHNAQ